MIARIRKHKTILLVALLLLLSSAAGGAYWLFADLPALADLESHLQTPSIRITDRNGRLLYEVVPEVGGRHTVLSLEAIPLALQQATIATEDSGFYQSPGVELRGIVRAFWINLRGGETLAGGSTITQQIAKNLLLDESERTERSIRRKLRESWLAWRLARTYTKDEILALYLNQMNYGGLAYGVEAAAQTYFGKPVGELDLAESAMLAGIPQVPAVYNPLTNYEAARERQLVVLGLMFDQGYITIEQRDLAIREKLVFSGDPYPIKAPHFVYMVRSQLAEMIAPEELATRGGLSVRTTLDLDWQEHAERAITRQLAELERGDIDHNVNNAAVVALDPNNGDILALAGSADYFDAEIDGAVNMVTSPRQPGSALKPIIYAAAFDPKHPDYWTAATMLLDVTTTFQTQDGKTYTPQNFDGKQHGPVLARDALAQSLNIPAVLTMEHVGLQTAFDLSAQLGITTFDAPSEYDLSLSLGGGAVTLLELSNAYAAFANGGYRNTPRMILEISAPDGEVLYESTPVDKEQVLDARIAWLISDILSDNNARTPQFGQNSALRLDRPAAVKTGTTTNFHDNWTIGYTPDLVVGVWVGNSDHEAMKDVTGLTGAGPIWHQVMRSLLGGQPEEDFEQPPGLVQVEVCALSGLLPSEACPYRRNEWFLAGTQPTETDNVYQEVIIDRATGGLAGEDTPPERQAHVVALNLPPQAHPWARSEGLVLYSDILNRTAALDNNAGNAPALSIVSPAYNAVYRLAVETSAESQRVRLEAASNQPLQNVYLYIDGTLVATLAAPPYTTWWVLTEGEHEIWAEGNTANGESLTSEVYPFRVIGDESAAAQE
ncbi:MAG: penicillin-binding protein 1C [Anaerolineales bacterium]|nr:penicillin-binding protein 1C [Anaerolineales bacterium]